MQTDFSFQKLYLADKKPAQSAHQLINWLDEKCVENGLQPVPEEAAAHFTYLLIESESNWLHFSSTGHFLPQSSEVYSSMVQLLSDDHHLVDIQIRDGGPYILRRFDQQKVVGRYAVYGDDGRYESIEAAEPWNPVYAAWQGLLAPGITSDQFYRLLPPPQHVDSPTPIVAIDYFDLPEHFNLLFGWHRELNYAAVAFRPDGPDGRGDFYESEAGDYVDQERDLRIYVRHYAHPDGDNKYSKMSG